MIYRIQGEHENQYSTDVHKLNNVFENMTTKYK